MLTRRRQHVAAMFSWGRLTKHRARELTPPGAALMTSRRIPYLAVLALAMATSAHAQIYQTDFPPDELRARCERLMARMGDDTVAVVQGAPLPNGFGVPRQSNTMYYLSGIETPGAYLVLDGRT